MISEIEKNTLIGLSVEKLRAILEPFKQPDYRAVQIYKWVHHHHVPSFEEMTNLPRSLREALAEQFSIRGLELADQQFSRDGTRKYLWKVPGGHPSESVFIPDEKRRTVCISSQVGCAMGCGFCATGQMGFSANLSPGQIVEQVVRVQEDVGEKITNVVLMGMGEPFLNYPRVMQACKIFTDPQGLAIAAKKVTISTVGIVPRIYQFADENRPFSLAISLHAATQELREQIMPVAAKFPLDQLIRSAQYYSRKSGKRITFEYVLLERVNDSPADARQLIRLLSPLRCKLNLIPYNDANLGYRRPEESRMEKFLAVIENARFAVTLRRSRGTDIAAACGQLYAEDQSAAKRRSLKLNLDTATLH